MRHSLSLLTIVVALPSEAKPLLEKYNLKKEYTCKPFSVYRNPKLGINLCVSGVGKVNVSASVAYMSQLMPSISYLNLGIAGGQYELGKTFLADKIIDVATSQNFYPQFNRIKNIESNTLITHDRPALEYPEVGLVEMEASAFFKSASLFVSQECLQVIKVVSDSSRAQQHHITPKLVEELIQKSLDKVDTVVQAMLVAPAAEVECLPNEIDISEFTAIWHFTQYQQHELRSLIRRWQVLQPNQIAIDQLRPLRDPKVVLAHFHSMLEQVEYVW